MKPLIRGIEADLGDHWADTFHNDQHTDLKADFILANPPFEEKMSGLTATLYTQTDDVEDAGYQAGGTGGDSH